VYVPVFPPAGLSPALADPATWARFARLRGRVEADGGADELAEIRSVLAPVETELWEEADAVADAGDPARQDAFAASAWRPVEAALDKLAV
jgi:hypothetical protein